MRTDGLDLVRAALGQLSEASQVKHRIEVGIAVREECWAQSCKESLGHVLDRHPSVNRTAHPVVIACDMEEGRPGIGRSRHAEPVCCLLRVGG